MHFLIVLKILLCGSKSSNIQEERRWIQNPVVCLGWSENKIMVFNNENNDLNPLAAYYFSFMLHL